MHGWCEGTHEVRRARFSAWYFSLGLILAIAAASRSTQAQQPAARAAGRAAPLRREGPFLIGNASTSIDGVEVGIELSRVNQPPADDPDGPPEPWQIVRLEAAAFDRVFLFYDNKKPIDFLEEILDQEMKAVERVCPLELDKRRKLRLAARGDIQQVLEQIEELRPQFEQTWAAPENNARDALRQASEFGKRAAIVRKALQTGPFNSDSLFEKNLRRMVTKHEFADISEKRQQLQSMRKSRGLPEPLRD